MPEDAALLDDRPGWTMAPEWRAPAVAAVGAGLIVWIAPLVLGDFAANVITGR